MGGLFSKSDSADRYAVYLTRLGSVLGRRIKIKRLWQVGRAGRRRDSPGTCSRGGGSPNLAKLGRPGIKSTQTWVWGGLRSTCSPPGAFAGLGEALRPRVMLGYFLGAKEFMCVRKANASQNKSHGRLCCAAAIPPWQSYGGGAPAVVFLLLGWPMCQGI